jgi:hypothetical protein
MSESTPEFCELPLRPAPVLPSGLTQDRMDAIVQLRTKWVNGTVLHYYFFDRDTDGTVVNKNGTLTFVSWVGGKEQQDVVRECFQEWQGLGIGLRLTEVADRSEAEIRIGFMPGDGSWSYVGRDVLDQGVDRRTMNFGWDLTAPGQRRTALHEIGHTLGMPHEHQNPNAGIEWDEELVYATLAGPPNFWPREKTHFNILRKLDPGEVSGSAWDPQSIMQYPFPPRLIRTPAEYHQNGVNPPGVISDTDAGYMRQWYPPLDPAQAPRLRPFQSVPLSLGKGEQADFTIAPEATRDYTVRTFGPADAVSVLFEEIDGELRYLAGDDDSGQERNTEVKVRLFKGRRYVVRVRVYSSWQSNETAVMYW